MIYYMLSLEKEKLELILCDFSIWVRHEFFCLLLGISIINILYHLSSTVISFHIYFCCIIAYEFFFAHFI